MPAHRCNKADFSLGAWQSAQFGRSGIVQARIDPGAVADRNRYHVAVYFFADVITLSFLHLRTLIQIVSKTVSNSRNFRL